MYGKTDDTGKKNDEFGAARTNKKEFLEKMDRIIPWGEFVAIVQPHDYKGEHGNKPHPICRKPSTIKKLSQSSQYAAKNYIIFALANLYLAVRKSLSI